MFSCSTGVGSFFDLLHFELRRLRDRNGNLVLARQLRLARRLLHLVAATAAAAARPRLAQPDDVVVRLIGQHGGRRSPCSSRSRMQKHQRRPRRRDVRTQRASKGRGDALLLAARTGTGRRPDARPPTWTDRCPADAFTRTSAVWLARPSGMVWGSSKYCRARSQMAATAKGVPRNLAYLLDVRRYWPDASCSRISTRLADSDCGRVPQTRPVQAPIAALPPP